MTSNSANESIFKLIQEYSSAFDKSVTNTAIILAAGHGKRIKSNTSKMLHKIWEVTTVERVLNACKNSIENLNSIIVVGIKADEVIKTIGRNEKVSFAYQETQNGTGHAVQVGLNNINNSDYNGTIYVFPGDMGLLDSATVSQFKSAFEHSGNDMMVLTGIFEGPVEENHYGRIVRVKQQNSKGEISADFGKVIEIIEYKDILKLSYDSPYVLKYNGDEYSYTKKELLDNPEFNSGVYAFKFSHLNDLIGKIENNNAQKELYITDLISIFNKNGLTVGAVPPKEQHVVMGFNTKSVLNEMNAIAQKIIYNKIKDIITIDDPTDFFIDETIVEDIVNLDKEGTPLEIQIGKGAYLGKGLKINSGLKIGKNVSLNGNIQLGKNISVCDNSTITCFYGQQVVLHDFVEIYPMTVIKGNVNIGENSRIESFVRITGTDSRPTQIGSNVVIKGTSYLLSCQVEENITIENSVLIQKKIVRPANSKTDFKVKYYFPKTEGEDGIKNVE